MLLDKGVRPGGVGDVNGISALSIAAKVRNEVIVRILLDKGADRMTTWFRSRTSLIEAIKGGCGTIVKILLDAGSDPQSGKKGETALDVV